MMSRLLWEVEGEKGQTGCAYEREKVCCMCEDRKLRVREFKDGHITHFSGSSVRLCSSIILCRTEEVF